MLAVASRLRGRVGWRGAAAAAASSAAAAAAWYADDSSGGSSSSMQKAPPQNLTLLEPGLELLVHNISHSDMVVTLQEVPAHGPAPPVLDGTPSSDDIFLARPRR